MTDTATLQREQERIVKLVLDELSTMRYGQLTIVVNGGHVTRVKREDSVWVREQPKT